MKNHYKILGVTPDSSQAEIKKAYKLLAVKHHPDKNNGDRHSEERFKEIAEAYHILYDDERREAYDFEKKYNRPKVGSQDITSTTFLNLIRRIKNRIFHAGGHIDENALFKLLSEILSEKNIELMVKSDDLATNSLIIDETIVSSIFLSYSHKAIIYNKLTKLADNNPWFLEKIPAVENDSTTNIHNTANKKAETPYAALAVFFILLGICIFLILVV